MKKIKIFRFLAGSLAFLACTSTMWAQATKRPSTAAKAAGNGHRITVGPNVHVSGGQSGLPHNEVIMAADPADVHRLLACSILGHTLGGEQHTVLYASSDGGASWKTAVIDPMNAAADPTCTFGLNGAAYFADLSMPLDERTGTIGGDRLIRVFRSSDGKTWDSVLLPNVTVGDRPTITVDHSDSKYRGRVYVFGYDNNNASLWHSDDDGKTFSAPARDPSVKGIGTAASNAAIMSDGTFVALIGEVHDIPPGQNSSGSINIATSSDGGATLKVTKVADAYFPWAGEVGASFLPAFTVDTSTGPFKDRLYAFWVDGRFGDRSQVLCSYSADKGKTWSVPRVVNDNRQPALGERHHGASLPVAAVNKDGVLGTMWYDRRAASRNNYDYTPRFAASSDGGETFGASVAVSTTPNVLNGGEQWLLMARSRDPYGVEGIHFNVERNTTPTSGDTSGLAAGLDGTFHALWTDNRTGIDQVWTAAVTVAGTAAKNGSPELATMTDVSQKVLFQVTDAAYDRSTQQITLTARLKNTSQNVIAAPLILRATDISSELGAASILNADNGETYQGATWRFPAVNNGPSLAPGETTAVRTLRFHLSNVVPYEHGSNFHLGNGGFPGMLDVQGKVLTK